jgi:hypothetical protein
VVRIDPVLDPEVAAAFSTTPGAHSPVLWSLPAAEPAGEDQPGWWWEEDAS